ncbi:MAG: lysophospholipid acyltransferase family protein [Pseudomonadota bacterium]
MPKVPDDVTDFTPPPPGFVHRSLAPLRRWFSPRYYGLDNVRADVPSLFVGNHTIFGVIDSPLIFGGLYEKTGVFVRSLGDHYHYVIPGWGDLLLKYGSVPGTPENCAALMQAGQHVLVFPGGAREVAKRRGEENRLTWKKRTGFARMAIEHQYPIVPFASLGADDMYTIVYDAEDFRASWLGRRLLGNERLAKLLRDGDLFMPLVRGLGPTALPRPERFYFMFGKPIPTTPWAGRADDRDAQWELRREVQASVESMLASLQAIRADDDDLPLWRKVLTRRA